MAIDTAEKRMSALNFGLPWFRVLPEVDGGIEADDRQHLLGLYSGIAASVVPDGVGVEFTLPTNRAHYTLPTNRPHYDMPLSVAHYTIPKEN